MNRLGRSDYLLVDHWILGLGLIINGIQANDIMKESMEFRVTRRIVRHLEQRQEYVGEDLFEIVDEFVRFEDVV